MNPSKHALLHPIYTRCHHLLVTVYDVYKLGYAVIIYRCFIYTGAFVPLTMEGNIVVDGVLASCHASFNHDLAQVITTPLRWFPELMDWIDGDDDGFHVYAKIGMEVGWMIMPSQQKH